MIPLLKNLGLYNPRDWDFADYTIAYDRGSVVMKEKKKALAELMDLFPEQREEMSQLYSEMVRWRPARSPFERQDVAHRQERFCPYALDHRSREDGHVQPGGDEGNDGHEYSGSLQEYLPPSEYRDRMTNVGYRNKPVGMGAGFWFTWFEDYWYYKRGLQALMDDMAKSFVAQGGVMHCNQTVDRILVEKNKATGVKTKGRKPL